jgi:hypothetical protein
MKGASEDAHATLEIGNQREWQHRQHIMHGHLPLLVADGLAREEIMCVFEGKRFW